MSWIHCNKCLKQPDEYEQISLLITSCGTLICFDCNNKDNSKGSNKECGTCNSLDCSRIPLNSKISPQVKEFFQDPTEIIKKYLKVVEFQRGHREKLIKNRREEQKKLASHCQKLSSANDEAINQVQQLRVEKNSLVQENNQLKSRVKELETRLLGEQSLSCYPPVGPSRHTPNGPLRQTPNRPSSSTPDHQAESRQRLSGHSNSSTGNARGVQAPFPMQPPPSRASVNNGPAQYFPVPQAQMRSTVLLGQQTPAFLRCQPTATPFRFPKPPRNQTSSVISSSYRTPLHVNKMSGIPSRSRQSVSSTNSRLTYDRVYSFMSAAADEALNPKMRPSSHTAK